MKLALLVKDFIVLFPRQVAAVNIYMILGSNVPFGLCSHLNLIADKSKANNIVGLLAVRFFVTFSQPTHIVVSSLQLIHGPLVSLTDFLCSCVQAGCKLTARFSSLSSTSVFSRLTAYYYTCSHRAGRRRTTSFAEPSEVFLELW